MSLSTQPAQGSGQVEKAAGRSGIAADKTSPRGKTPVFGDAAGRAIRSRRPPHLTLPGGGRWPWWGWALYAVFAVPLLLVALIPAAALRLVLPHRRLWGFQQRRSALRYLVIVALIAASGAIVWGRPARTTEQIMHSLTLWSSVLSPPAAATATERAATGVPAAGTPRAPAPPAVAAGAPALDAPSSGALEAAPQGAPQAVPEATSPSSAASTPRRVVVGNTGGAGVAFRHSTRWADRWPGVAWADGTALIVLEDQLIGDDGAGGTTRWLRVRDPAGREGFVPAAFVVPAA